MKATAVQPSTRGTKTALLVIGYGNELRCDDGVGPKTAAAVAEWNLPKVRTLVCHQLTPELAPIIAEAQCVVFVDAAVASPICVELRELQPDDSPPVMDHAADPLFLLDCAKKLFGHCPLAYWLTISVENMGFGENLSSGAREGLEIALEKIRALALIHT